MRLIIQIAVTALVAIAASAQDQKVGPPEVPLPTHFWVVELIQPSGDVTRFGVFNTEKECEDAIPKYEKQEHGYNGHCVEHKRPK
jgi:hypothetical protein